MPRTIGVTAGPHDLQTNGVKFALNMRIGKKEESLAVPFQAELESTDDVSEVARYVA